MFIDTIVEHISSLLGMNLREFQQKWEVDMQNTLNSFIRVQNALLKGHPIQGTGAHLIILSKNNSESKESIK